MSIYLGNLNIDDIQERVGVMFPDELVGIMKESHQACASNVKQGQWHCFDVPFILVCGDIKTAENIFKYLKPIASRFSKPMQIGIQSNGEET